VWHPREKSAGPVIKNNARQQCPEMIRAYFCLKMHQNVFSGRAPPGPAGSLVSAYSVPHMIPSRMKGRGKGKRKGERGRKGRGRTPLDTA